MAAQHVHITTPSMVTPEEYKQAKIDFVSNLSGCDKSDLFVVFAVAGV